VSAFTFTALGRVSMKMHVRALVMAYLGLLVMFHTPPPGSLRMAGSDEPDGNAKTAPDVRKLESSIDRVQRPLLIYASTPGVQLRHTSVVVCNAQLPCGTVVVVANKVAS
jgi:hypothetical protein